MVQLFKNKKFEFFCKISLLGHNWFPGIVTRKSIIFQGTIPGNQLISGYCYPEINWFLSNNTRYCDLEINLFPGNNTRKFSKKTTFDNIPSNLGKNQQIYSEIFGTFPGIVTQKLIDFWVTIPGNQLISGYCAPEVEFCEKN